MRVGKGWPIGEPAPPRSDGDGYNFLLDHVGYQGDDCLTYPLKGRDGQGRAMVGVGGKLLLAHRVMCRLAHGEPPEGKPYAAHECGNGHLACVNPRHLSWKDDKENARDRVRHGRNRGLHTGGHGLSLADIEQIQSEEGKTKIKDLAARYGVSRASINRYMRMKRNGQKPRIPTGARKLYNGRWAAVIIVNREQIALGCYNTQEEATAVYRAAVARVRAGLPAQEAA